MPSEIPPSLLDGTWLLKLHLNPRLWMLYRWVFSVYLFAGTVRLSWHMAVCACLLLWAQNLLSSWRGNLGWCCKCLAWFALIRVNYSKGEWLDPKMFQMYSWANCPNWFHPCWTNMPRPWASACKLRVPRRAPRNDRKWREFPRDVTIGHRWREMKGEWEGWQLATLRTDPNPSCADHLIVINSTAMRFQTWKPSSSVWGLSPSSHVIPQILLIHWRLQPRHDVVLATWLCPDSHCGTTGTGQVPIIGWLQILVVIALSELWRYEILGLSSEEFKDIPKLAVAIEMWHLDMSLKTNMVA